MKFVGSVQCHFFLRHTVKNDSSPQRPGEAAEGSTSGKHEMLQIVSLH